MRVQRLPLYQQIEADRGSKLLVYVTGDRPGLETQIHPEVLDNFSRHLDTFGLPDKISLLLYSGGGSTLAGWSIANLIRQFCKTFEVIVPAKAHSTATLIALGANAIMMTKQATLGPIDPSTNGALNPQIPGAPPNARLPVSVEDVAAYFDLAKKQAGLSGDAALTAVFQKLADHVHPITLGNVYRARAQIQMLARRLLQLHLSDKKIIDRIIAFVCSESGSHDYTIYRREAKEQLALPVVKPSQAFYDNVLRPTYLDIRSELQLDHRFDPQQILGDAVEADYTAKRVLIESITGGQHNMTTTGKISKKLINTPQGPIPLVDTSVSFDTWNHEA